MVYLFVYGTLMRGYWNDLYLENAKFICECKTVEDYSLILKGQIPFLNSLNKLYKISGELYDVSDEDLKDIDILEGNESFYFRRKMNVIGDDNKEYEVYAYFNSIQDGITLSEGNFKKYITN